MHSILFSEAKGHPQNAASPRSRFKQKWLLIKILCLKSEPVFSNWTGMDPSHAWSHNTDSCPFTRAHSHVISLLVSEKEKKKKKTALLGIIYQKRALPALLFRDLEASVASATQTDPAAPRGSSFSTTQGSRVGGGGRRSLGPRTDFFINWLCDFPCALYYRDASVSTTTFIKKK